MGHFKNILVAYIDASATQGAICRIDNRAVLADLFERRAYHLRFRADLEAVHAIVAVLAFECGNAWYGKMSEQAVKSAHRTEMAAPAARGQQQVIKENGQQNQAAQTKPEEKAALHH